MKKSIILLLITLGFMFILTGFGLFMLNNNSNKVFRENGTIIRDSDDKDDDFIDNNDKNNNKEIDNNDKNNNSEVDSNEYFGKFNLSKSEINTLLKYEFVSLADVIENKKNSASNNNDFASILNNTYNDFLRNADIDSQTVEEVKKMIKDINDGKLVFNIKGSSKVTISIGSDYKDSGFTCTINGVDRSNYVIVESSVDAMKSGTYTVNYYLVVGDYCKIITRSVIVNNEEGIITVSKPDSNTGNVGLYIKANLNDMNQFYSIVLPDGTEVFDKEYGYYVEENGSYVFEIKKKVNGNVSSAFKKTIEVADIDRRNSNALADRTRCVGTYVDSYSSNSLKYTLCDTGYYIISSIWLSNPYNQIKVGLGGNPTGLRTVPQIMSTEVPQNSGKAYLATNGSLYVSPDWPDVYDNFKHISGWNYTSVSSILINDGKIIHDYHDQFDSGSYYLFGLSKDGYLKEYTLSGVNKPGQSQSSSNSNDKKNDKTIDKMINTDLIRYSLVTSQKLIKKDGTLSKNNSSKALRTAICQIDRNNFIMLSSKLAVSYNDMAKYFKDLGCISAYNLDGGGSRQLVYQTNNKTITYLRSSDAIERPVAEALYFVEQ